MTKHCNCYGKNKFDENDRRLTTLDNAYLEGKQISELWEEINFAANPDIANNNFTKSLLWGTKWANLPNNELTWTINYNGTRTTMPGNSLNLITPTQNMINSSLHG